MTDKPNVIDATAQTVEKRLKDVEDYASQIDEALGQHIDAITKRLDALDGKVAAGGGSAKLPKKLTERIDALEAGGGIVQRVVNPSADAPPAGVDSMGIPRVIDA